MVNFTWSGTFGSGPDFSGISDIDLLFINGDWRAYLTTRQVPGYTVLSLDPVLATATPTGRIDLAPSSGMPSEAAIIERSGSTWLAALGQDATGYPGYTITAAGNLGSVANVTPDSGSQASLTASATLVIGAETFLFGGQYGTTTLQAFRVETDGLLSRLGTGQLGDGTASAVAAATVNGKHFVFAASGDQAAIDTYAVWADGLMTLVSPGGPENTIGLAAIRKLETVTLDGATYLLVASGGANALSVFEVASSGALVPRDHVIDDLSTRFAAVAELAVTTFRGRVFVAAAGSDDGISLFELIPGGHLLHLQTFEDQVTTTLDNVSGLGFAFAGNVLSILVSSDTETGVTLFSADLGAPGQAISGSAGGDVLFGSSEDDRIAGLDGDDVLFGSAGDDILSDGRGSDTLTGGSGADRFVLSGDYAADTIIDFDHTKDRLDLSGWEFLRTPSQITHVPTATGALLTFGAEVLEIHSGTGQTLTLAQLSLDTAITSTHAFYEGPSFLPVITGTNDPNAIDGNESDNLLEALGGDDTLSGMEGADTLDGGEGIDLADYSRSKTSVLIDMTNAAINTGEAAGDTYVAIEGLTGSNFGDNLRANHFENIVYGGQGNDILRGRMGNDRLFGDDGDDLIYGGKHRDTIEGGHGNDTIYGENGKDKIYGGRGNDVIHADIDSDWISAGRGHDVVYGGDGKDRIDGGHGRDTLTGGAQADTFIYYSGLDRITDFRNDVDTLVLKSSLWGGANYTPQHIIDLFVVDVGTDLHLDFRNGNLLVLEGVNHAIALLDDMIL